MYLRHLGVILKFTFEIFLNCNICNFQNILQSYKTKYSQIRGGWVMEVGKLFVSCSPSQQQSNSKKTGKTQK